MLKLTRFFKWIDSPYHDFWIRLSVSLFAGHLIVSHGYGFFAVLIAPGYFLSLIYSTLISLILFQGVNSITVMLDHYLPWIKQLNLRFLAQTLVGFLAMCVFAYGLAAGLFLFMGQRIQESDYMKYDFLFVCIYVFLTNTYYYVYERLNRKKVIQAELDHYKNYHRNYAFKQAPVNLKDIDLITFGITPTTIACICRIKGVMRVYDMNGHYTPSQEKQEVFLNKLPKDDYYTLNRFCIVHRLLVYKVKEASSRRVAVVLRVPFDLLLPAERKEVSQGNKEVFLKAYHQAN